MYLASSVDTGEKKEEDVSIFDLLQKNGTKIQNSN